MKISAIQYQSVAGDIDANIARHLKFIELARAQGTGLVFFPELSLTGYEPQLAEQLATTVEDPRLEVFQQRSDAGNMVIGVGLPLAVEGGVQIGMVWFAPHEPRRTYAKQQLHADELPFFVPGTSQLLLKAGGVSLAPAVCFESLQPDHAATAADLGASVYLASVAKPARGLARAVLHYPEIARKHGMQVIMANGLGRSDNFIGVGQSAAWNHRGELLAQMDDASEGIVILDTERGEE